MKTTIGTERREKKAGKPREVAIGSPSQTGRKIQDLFLEAKKDGSGIFSVDSVKGLVNELRSQRKRCIAAIKSLGSSDHEEVLSTVVSIGEDREIETGVRCAAIDVASRLGDSKIAGKMTVLILKDKSDTVKIAAIRSIPRIARRNGIDYDEVSLLDRVRLNEEFSERVRKASKRARYSIRGVDIVTHIPSH